MQGRRFFMPIFIISLVAAFLTSGNVSAQAAVPHVNLCTSGNYLLLGSVITNGAGTRITSTFPGAIVGAASSFDLLALVGSESGVTNESDFAAHTAAMSNLTKALDAITLLSASGKKLITAELSTEHSGNLPLGTFGPGVYSAANALNVVAGATITLDAGGDPDANFYFISGNALTLGAGVIVRLANGAKAENVYWVAGTFSGDATLGATSTLYGNILVNGAATVGAGVNLSGRLLARGALTLGATVHITGIAANTGCLGNTVTVPVITGQLPPAGATMLTNANLPIGSTTGVTTIGATPSNNGTIASYSPIGVVPEGTPISYVTYNYVVPNVVPSIVFTDVTLVNGKAGDSYADSVEAKTQLGTLFSGQPIVYSIAGSLPTGLVFYPTTGQIAGTISRDATVKDYALSVSATSAGYPVQTLSYVLRVTAPTTIEVATPGPAIIFTDTTLVDGRIGEPYMDYVEAKTLIGATASGQQVTYSISGALPAGLAFYPASGYVAGIVSKDATVGIYPVIISASSPGYSTISTSLTFKVLPVLISNPTIPNPTTTVNPSYSIAFTDTTLVDAKIGKAYSDYVKAKTFIGQSLSEKRVTYSLTGALPSGLVFSSSTGYIAGAVSKTTTAGTFKLVVSAFSIGYPTAKYTYDLIVKSATTPPPVVTIPVTPEVTPPVITVPEIDSNSAMVLMSTVWFASGRAALTPATTLALDSLLLSLRASGLTHIVINGYTDAAPGQSHLTLSLARAYSVSQYLLARNGALKISMNGLGLAPESLNSTGSSQASRKTEIWVS